MKGDDYLLKGKAISEANLEKKVFTNLLLNTRMCEIIYNETLSLVFYKEVKQKDSDAWITKFLTLTIDTLCWFGEKEDWEYKVNNIVERNNPFGNEDSLLGYELIKLRYYNWIVVEEIKFFEEYVQICFNGGFKLSMTYDSDSDYSWVLIEKGDEKDETRMYMCCQGNELFMKNIPEIYK